MRGANNTLSVYVVDDDEAVRESFIALLETEGFSVRGYPSADEFLTDLTDNPSGYKGSGCLLLDINMPGKGGWELLDALEERDCRLPVVLMTGNIDERTKPRVLKNGAFAFLEKPVDADLLIETLRSALSS